MAEDVVVTGIAPMCRAATTVDALRARPTGGEGETQPAGDWFEAERFLGPRGWKYFTPATRLLLAATRGALEDARLADDAYPPEARGVFVGTNFAVHAILEELDRTLLTAGSEAIQPMWAPNFSVNIPASTLSIKHRFQAFNVTVSDAMVAGLEAVILGAEALRRGRAGVVLCGATEDEPPAETARLIGVSRGAAGACALILETAGGARARGARTYARLGAGWLGFAPPAQGDDLEARLEPALACVAADGGGAVPLASLTAPFAFNRAVIDAVKRVLGRRGLEAAEVRGVGASGAHATASAVLELATLAAVHGHGVAVATSPQGHVAVLCLEKLPVAPTTHQTIERRTR